MWKLKLSTNNAQSNLHSIIVPIYDVLSITTHDVMFPNQGLQFFFENSELAMEQHFINKRISWPPYAWDVDERISIELIF